MFFCAEALSRCLVQGVKKERCTILRENLRYANFEWSWVLESTDVGDPAISHIAMSAKDLSMMGMSVSSVANACQAAIHCGHAPTPSHIHLGSSWGEFRDVCPFEWS